MKSMNIREEKHCFSLIFFQQVNTYTPILKWLMTQI